MAKFYGVIGFATEQLETSPGIWENHIVERQYKGDVLRQARRNVTANIKNDDLQIDNTISIVMDDYLNQNLDFMLYINLYGSKWKVSSIEFLPPRVNLTIGGLYNG